MSQEPSKFITLRTPKKVYYLLKSQFTEKIPSWAESDSNMINQLNDNRKEFSSFLWA